MDVINRLEAQAKAHKTTIALSDGDDPRAIKAAITAQQNGVSNIILVGSESKIRAQTSVALAIQDPSQSEHTETLAKLLVERRGHQGIGLEEARELAIKPHIYAAYLVQTGLADGCLGGATVSTATIIQTALQIIGADRTAGIISSYFLMLLQEHQGERPVIFTDCSLLIEPRAIQLAKIAMSASRALPMYSEETPKIAMLSFSTNGSADHPSVSKMQRATAYARELAPDLDVDGELQFDAAFVPSVAASKAPNSSVAGNANIFVFPNLDAGNIGYKIAERIGGATAIGPILQGLNRPANDLSRGCSSDDIYKMILVTATQIIAQDR